MEIYDTLDFHICNSAVSLGKFDGIHRGHRLLMSEILKRDNSNPTVFTFGASPGNGVMSKQQIYSKREQQLILEKMGIAREVIFPFNEHTKEMSPEKFIKEVLIERMDARFICVGEDFHFGKERSGNIQMLKAGAKKYGYELKIIPKLEEDGEVISSTRVRWELSTGNLENVNKLLGAPYFIHGQVVHGNALGRTIHMPTANILPEANKLLPVYGVYAATIDIDGKIYKGVSNIGLKPTVGAENASVETFIMDFDEDIYGKEITVYFHHFLRREKKFSSIESLSRQMEQDRENARKILG